MLLTEAEITLVAEQRGKLGSFYTALMRAIRIADMENRARLALGFPALVNAAWRFQNDPGYWEDVCKRWNTQFPDDPIKS